MMRYWQYFKEAISVINEMTSGLITEDEAGREITRLRRKYGLKDK